MPNILSPRRHHIHSTHAHSFAIRSEGWTLIEGKSGYHSGRYQDWEKRRKVMAEAKGGRHLFHIEEDIGQRKNLIGENPDKAKKLSDLMNKLRDQGHSAPRLAK